MYYSFIWGFPRQVFLVVFREKVGGMSIWYGMVIFVSQAIGGKYTCRRWGLERTLNRGGEQKQVVSFVSFNRGKPAIILLFY